MRLMKEKALRVLGSGTALAAAMRDKQIDMNLKFEGSDDAQTTSEEETATGTGLRVTEFKDFL